MPAQPTKSHRNSRTGEAKSKTKESIEETGSNGVPFGMVVASALATGEKIFCLEVGFC